MFLFLTVVVLVLFWRSMPREQGASFSQHTIEQVSTEAQHVSTEAQQVPTEAHYSSQFVSHGETTAVHSVTAVAVSDAILRAFWYGGTREGAQDVAIYSSEFDAAAVAWSEPEIVVDRMTAQRELHRYVRKLGNPVVYKPTDTQLWLFYVSVSVGGWAGSSINLMISNDLGESWQPTRRLVTSPFFNISTLVKGPALSYQDGSVGLPVYHEFIGKFGELLRLDEEGNPTDKIRLSRGTHSLQPVIIPIDDLRASGFMRYAGESPRRVLFISSGDGGKSWSSPEKSALPNPNSAVSVIKLVGGDLLMAFNNSDDGREDLTLAVSRNQGHDWNVMVALEQAEPEAQSHQYEYSYPWLLQSADGIIHLLYTWNKERIKHALFNRAWLDEQANKVDVK